METETVKFNGINPEEILCISTLPKANGDYTFIHRESK